MKPNQERVTNHVISRDGTTIAYERSGTGPAVILVDGALCSRAFGPSPRSPPECGETLQALVSASAVVKRKSRLLGVGPVGR